MHSQPSVRAYVAVWVILTIMTFATYYIAQIDLGPWNIVIALLIAFFKMSLVVLIFMNVRADNPLTKLFVGAGFFWMAILLALTLGDYVSRYWMPGGKWW